MTWRRGIFLLDRGGGGEKLHVFETQEAHSQAPRHPEVQCPDPRWWQVIGLDTCPTSPPPPHTHAIRRSRGLIACQLGCLGVWRHFGFLCLRFWRFTGLCDPVFRLQIPWDDEQILCTRGMGPSDSQETMIGSPSPPPPQSSPHPCLKGRVVSCFTPSCKRSCARNYHPQRAGGFRHV